MTPFGAKVRVMRAARNITLKDMAAALGVSGAYLSAMEHGHRGRPSWPFVQRVITYFNVIWDEAEDLERLAGLSDPRVTVNTAGLDARATELANRLAAIVSDLDGEQLDKLLGIVTEMSDRRPDGGSERRRQRP